MGESYGRRGEGSSVRAALRIVAGGSNGPSRDAGQLLSDTLEQTDRAQALPARIEAAPPLESSVARPIHVAEHDGFAGFLDGIQRSRVLHHIDGIVPVVHATIAAAVRERRERAMHTWGGGARVVRAVILPFALVDRGVIGALANDGFEVADSAPAPENSAHPLQLLAAARLVVQQRRETMEAELVAEWCNTGAGALYVDGGLGGLTDASRQPQVIGVVKSHRALYGDAQVSRAIAALRVGERSPAFVVSTRRRASVASWYLRLRDGAGDPLGGLVRVEIAEPSFSAAHADEVSGWILREREPAALPDPRWRVMAYGIRDCEEYLRAVTA
jgi:hypothetical protein